MGQQGEEPAEEEGGGQLRGPIASVVAAVRRDCSGCASLFKSGFCCNASRLCRLLRFLGVVPILDGMWIFGRAMRLGDPFRSKKARES
jgi:hypothetical protein